MKKSRGVVSEKEKLSLLVKQIAKGCSSLEELSRKLIKNSLMPYHRKEVLTGVWLGRKKFRLGTLGIESKHLKQMTREQLRLDELKSLESDKIIMRDREIN